MNREEFLHEMSEVMQRDDALTLDMPLKDVEEWDSLAVLTVAAFISSRFFIRLTVGDFAAMDTVGDIARAAKLEL
jgi:acyl carrier protein